MARILIIAPHPDDEIIGCGGIIQKHREIEDHVSVLYLTSGDLTDNPNQREQESLDATEFLGVNEYKFLRWKDNRVGETPDARGILIEAIRKMEPHQIYCPSPDDQHIDHKATFELVSKIALVPLYLYEVYPGMRQLEAEDYEDITEQMPKKFGALKQFKSQKCNLAEAYRHHAAFRAMMSGVGDYAECFKPYVRA